MQNAFVTNNTGKLLVSKEALLLKGIYTDASYRNGKSKGRFQDMVINSKRYAIFETLPPTAKKTVVEKLSNLKSEYSHLLRSMQANGLDCSQTAVEFTAETLQINEPFIRSTVETYINSHFSAYTWAYLDAGLHSDSVKGYAKQCALIQWIYDFTQRINTQEPDTKRCQILLRSFRANLLTSLSNIEFEIKIPKSETRFHKWLDDVLCQMDRGTKPEEIIQIKRQGNANGSKITQEQLDIVTYWHTNGTNMSIATLYTKWVEFGKQKNWWLDEKGNYCPPTEGRLYQLLAPLKNPLTLAKTDTITHRLNCVPTVSRLLPEKKNHVWVIDGTAHNENVLFGNKVRQHVYTIKVADVATLRLLGVSPLIGVKEPFYAVREAILMGIRESGYKPAIIHCDRGPAWKELEIWCNENDIKLYPSMTSNARAKTIESLFNMFDNDITRFLRGYSGQNRTALSINSRSSEKRETQGKQNARSASIVMEWVANEGITAWNERIIETLERKPCNKTPFELWDEKESFTPQLSYLQLCQLCGTLHKRKLTIEGLEIEHNRQTYMYFPPIDTTEQRAVAEKVFTHTPLDAQNANQLSIYILKGGEPAPVFAHNGSYLGIWNIKPLVDFIDESGKLDDFMALQHRITEKAKTIISDVRRNIEKHNDFEQIEVFGNEMLTGKRRAYAGRYDKSELLADEAACKANDFVLTEETKEYREYADPDTGEVHRILVN